MARGFGFLGRSSALPCVAANAATARLPPTCKNWRRPRVRGTKDLMGVSLSECLGLGSSLRRRLLGDAEQKPTNPPVILHLRWYVLVMCRLRPQVVEPVGARLRSGHRARPHVQPLTVETLAWFQQWLAADAAEVLAVAAPCAVHANGSVARGEPREQH